jgi:hypothetical protein
MLDAILVGKLGRKEAFAFVSELVEELRMV